MLVISLPFNEDPAWAVTLYNNFTKYCKIPYIVVINPSTTAYTKQLVNTINNFSNWFISEHFSRKWGHGAFVVKAHCRNFNLALSNYSFDYFLPLATNCLFIKELTLTTIENFDLFKTDKQFLTIKEEGYDIKTYPGYHGQYYKPFFDMTNKFKYNFACTGLLEGLCLKKNIWNTIFNRMIEIGQLDNTDPVPAQEESFVHTIWYNEFYLPHNKTLPYRDGAVLAYWTSTTQNITLNDIAYFRETNNTSILSLKRFNRIYNDPLVQLVNST